MHPDDRPAALARRVDAWRRLRNSHRAGDHHPLLCASPSTCRAYGDVVAAQLDLVERALHLPAYERENLADRLDQPGPAPLAALVGQAESRVAGR